VSKKPTPAKGGRDTAALKALGSSLPKLTSKRKKLRNFQDLGWACAEASGSAAAGTAVVSVDIGVEGTCVTTWDKSFNKPKDLGQPTMILVQDPHAFRSLEPFSLEVGVPAADRWPGERVLRGTHGAIMLPSQIGLVEFPADHVLAGLVSKVRAQAKKQPKQVVLTLPTFLSSGRTKAIRDVAAPYRKGAFVGVPSAIAAGYFYLAPGIGRIRDFGMKLVQWSQQAFDAGRVLVLDWGASGLEYGLVSYREGKGDAKAEIRLVLAGIWPSLGGHRLTLTIVQKLKALLVQRILDEGASDELVPLALRKPGDQQVPRPFGYDEAIRALNRMGEPRNDEEAREHARLSNLLFPTRWSFPSGEEPLGYAPYRRLAVLHFNALWKAAERMKRLILSDPPRYERRRTVPWAIQLDSPFVSHLSGSVDFPVAELLGPTQESLDRCLRHIEGRLERRGVKAPVHTGLCGMQASSSLLKDAVERLAIRRDAGALKDTPIAERSSDPRELKSVVNRGAALLFRDKKGLDFGLIPDVLPFSIQIADALENIQIFSAGPLDELAVFQRRVRGEEGFPQSSRSSSPSGTAPSPSTRATSSAADSRACATWSATRARG
jgi:hypothetical protein